MVSNCCDNYISFLLIKKKIVQVYLLKSLNLVYNLLKEGKKIEFSNWISGKRGWQIKIIFLGVKQ